MRNLDVALDALAKGIAPVPCRPGTKVPLVPWKPWQTTLPTEEQVRRLFTNPQVNVAVVCTGRIIFDCDEYTKAELVLTECGPTPHMLKTPRGGVHLGYRRRKGIQVANVVRLKGHPIDIRTNGGLEMIPDSQTEDGEYRWISTEGLLPTDALPYGNIGWTRERVKRVMQPIVTPELAPDRARLQRRARGYLATVEGSVSGQRGHDRAMRAAGVLIQKFGLTIEEAWPLFKEWNETCEPPWSDAQLLHKLRSAWDRRK